MPVTSGYANTPAVRVDGWIRPPGTATSWALIEDSGSWPVGMTVEALVGNLTPDGTLPTPLLTVPFTIATDTATGAITGAQATTLESSVPFGQSVMWHIRGTVAGVVTQIATGLLRWDEKGAVTGTQTARVIVGPPGSGGAGSGVHNDLTGRTSADAHPIAAVTGLQTALDGKAAVLGVDDNYVTDAEKAALHSHSNKAALDLVSGTNTGDQTLPTWTTISGKPAVVADGATQAAARTSIDAAQTAHVHSGADITTGTVAAARLPAASETAVGVVELATVAEATTGTDTTRAVTAAGVKAVGDLKAPLSHTHAAADITSGTMATARLGSGTADATTYLRGDQTWATPAGGAANGAISPFLLMGA